MGGPRATGGTKNPPETEKAPEKIEDLGGAYSRKGTLDMVPTFENWIQGKLAEYQLLLEDAQDPHAELEIHIPCST